MYHKQAFFLIACILRYQMRTAGLNSNIFQLRSVDCLVRTVHGRLGRSETFLPAFCLFQSTAFIALPGQLNERCYSTPKLKKFSCLFLAVDET